MSWHEWMDIKKSKNMRSLVNLIRRYLALDNSSKNGFRHGESIFRKGLLFKFTKENFSLQSFLSMNNSIYTGKTTFYIKTFGCQMNYADSEKIHRVLLQAGAMKVLDPTQADIVIINTCSVRQK